MTMVKEIKTMPETEEMIFPYEILTFRSYEFDGRLCITYWTHDVPEHSFFCEDHIILN